MSLTEIGWTATPLTEVLTLLRDLRVDTKTFLPAGTHAAGTLVPGFTFNPWIGCEKVSRACKRCYAEAWSRRVGYTPDGHHHLRVWGPAATTPRVRTGADNWKRPRRWNRLAAELGVRLKVFSGSLCDVGEDHPLANEWRGEFFDLVEETENLDWLLLTKRPGHLADQWRRPWNKYGLKNAWVGATVEDQPSADARVRDLLRINAAVHFLSCEPLAGPVDLDPMWCDQCTRTEVSLRADGEWSAGNGNGWCNACEQELATGYCLNPLEDQWHRGVSWVIGGGESGPGHETLDIAHLLDLHRQVTRAGVAFFTKQDSGPHPGRQGRIPDGVWNTKQWPEVSHVE